MSSISLKSPKSPKEMKPYIFTEHEKAEIREQFNLFDLDKSGNIDSKEVRELLKAIGEVNAPGYRVRELIDEVDTNKNGTIEFDEFLYIVGQFRSGRSTGFGTIVQKAGSLNALGGNSAASAAGTQHSFSDEEKVAFVDWINYCLESDAECKKYLPIKEEGEDLFRKATDGIFLMKLINDAVPDTIDERAINKKASHPVQISENLTLMLNSARAIGCNVVNIDAQDVAAGTPHLLLGLIWQIIRIGLFARINIANVPGLARLLEGNETIQSLMALPVEHLLLRWFNYQLAQANHPRRVTNFGKDIKDSECYTILIRQIAPPGSGCDLTPLSLTEDKARAAKMLEQADKIGCRKFVRPADVAKGNQKLNLAFVANMFSMFPAMEVPEGIEVEELEEIQESREDKTYRNWMNSLGVDPFVNNLYQDLRDGVVLIQLFDKIQPGLVDWKAVNMPPWKKLGGNMKKLENCNYALELGKKMNFSLVGIGGPDIFDGHKMLTLAVVWQMMRAHTLSILNKLAGGGNRRIGDADIVEWVNKKLQAASKSTSILSFKDASITNSLAVIDLVDAIKPGSISYNLVFPEPNSVEEKMKNAKYAVSMARKIGATVFALPEDLVEVKPKMVLTVFATLMAVGVSQ